MLQIFEAIMSNTAQAQKLKLAKDSFGKVGNMFKKAQEGTLGPDEVKEFAEQAAAALQSAEAVIDTIIEEVPASETPGDIPPTNEEPQLEDPVDPPGDDEPPRVATDEEDEEKKQMQAKIAKLESQLVEMQTNTAKEKIAAEYASLFEPKQRSAKHSSIMKSKSSIPLLTAKLEEAKAILGNSKSKIASEDDDWRLYGQSGKQKNASMGEVRATNFLTV